ncbi:hypothetical protein [Pseudoscardovia suis]
MLPDSTDAKTLADAKQVARFTVDNANKTYIASDGNVQNNTTCNALKTALDVAKKVLSDDGMTWVSVPSVIQV